MLVKKAKILIIPNGGFWLGWGKLSEQKDGGTKRLTLLCGE